jgi:hypothetical protein
VLEGGRLMLTRRLRVVVPLLFVVLALAAVPVATARTPVAHAAGTCSVGNGRGYGYTYLTFLWVFRTSCANGKNLVKHKGHIHGWKCVTKRLDTSPVQYDDKVTCKSGSREVQWDFAQDT